MGHPKFLPNLMKQTAKGANRKVCVFFMRNIDLESRGEEMIHSACLKTNKYFNLNNLNYFYQRLEDVYIIGFKKVQKSYNLCTR